MILQSDRYDAGHPFFDKKVYIDFIKKVHHFSIECAFKPGKGMLLFCYNAMLSMLCTSNHIRFMKKHITKCVYTMNRI